MDSGTIIILNGTSSSGKTSLVNALQKVLTAPYLDAGIDKFIWMLPNRYLDRPLWDDVLGLATQAGPVGDTLIMGMHHAIAALSKAGNNVIADHVLVEPGWLQACIGLFSELPAFFIGVHCPLAVLEQREKARRDRTLGQARAQFEIVHSHTLYDLKVDTSCYSPEACALQIKARLENDKPPEAFKRLKRSLSILAVEQRPWRYAVQVEEGAAHGDLYELEQTTSYHIVDRQRNMVVMTFHGEMEARLSTETGMWDDCRYSGVCEAIIAPDERSVMVRYHDGHEEIVPLHEPLGEQRIGEKAGAGSATFGTEVKEAADGWPDMEA